jgi:hypothetical protein
MWSTLTQEDREWLARLLARPADVETREGYARALDDSGDPLRAHVVRLTARAIATGADVGLRDVLGALSSSAWARLIGASLLAEMESLGVSGYAPRWMPHVLPALSLHLEPEPNEDRPIGSTYFGGDPDLPAGTPWPTLEDCATFFGESRSVDPRSACHFIGQLAVSDLRQGLFGVTWPEHGLLSLFAFDEYDRHGISEVHVRYWSDIRQLRRVQHPVLDEANARRAPRRAVLEHALTIPDDYEGPWSADVRLAPEDDRGVPGHSGSPRVRSYRHLMSAGGGRRAGIFGHHSATTGADPTPDREWQRLFCVPDGDGVGWHHVAIRRTDLAACRLERWRSVWVDMDG